VKFDPTLLAGFDDSGGGVQTKDQAGHGDTKAGLLAKGVGDGRKEPCWDWN